MRAFWLTRLGEPAEAIRACGACHPYENGWWYVCDQHGTVIVQDDRDAGVLRGANIISGNVQLITTPAAANCGTSLPKMVDVAVSAKAAYVITGERDIVLGLPDEDFLALYELMGKVISARPREV